jgi:hypothetical protein
MHTALHRLARLFIISLLMAATAACNPALNWREVRGGDAPYTVLLPAKPDTFARAVDLNGLAVEMSMTAAEVDGVSYAVASARVPDARQRTAALAAMQEAMLRNIGASQPQERAVVLEGGAPALEVTARGHAGASKRAVMMHARFAQHGERVFQAVALGPADALTPEAAETFLESFTLR